jgi:hypothetical protein
MEDMEWFCSIIFCHMPPNSISFCPKFEVICQTFCQWQPKKWHMAGHILRLRSWMDIESSLTEPIWRTWNGLAASSSVTCLQTASALPKSWGKVQNLLLIILDNCIANLKYFSHFLPSSFTAILLSCLQHILSHPRHHSPPVIEQSSTFYYSYHMKCCLKLKK